MRAVVFDLDGTLIDSAPDLRAALNRLLARHGLPALDAAAVQSMIGDGAKVLVTRAFAAYQRQAGADDFKAFLDDYEANSMVETKVYPGIEAALMAIQAAGHPLAVCTNKGAAVSRIILQSLGLLKFLPIVVGGDSTGYRKPDPRHLEAALSALAARKAVMIGDHENDMAAARGLGIPAIFVSWGYGAATGSYTAHSAAELLGIIAGM
jgi:phosphoglycolate phosphatase